MDWPLRISADDIDNVDEKWKIREKPTNPLSLVRAVTTSENTKERKRAQQGENRLLKALIRVLINVLGFFFFVVCLFTPDTQCHGLITLPSKQAKEWNYEECGSSESERNSSISAPLLGVWGLL